MNTSGCWEQRPSGQVICRWMVAWHECENTILGGIAGYSGGGAFEVERFYGIVAKDGFESLWIDYTDKISGKEINFEKLSKKNQIACEEAIDEIWSINDFKIWNDTDNIVMKKLIINQHQFTEGLLLISQYSPTWIKELCNITGLSAHPS